MHACITSVHLHLSALTVEYTLMGESSRTICPSEIEVCFISVVRLQSEKLSRMWAPWVPVREHNYHSCCAIRSQRVNVFLRGVGIRNSDNPLAADDHNVKAQHAPTHLKTPGALLQNPFWDSSNASRWVDHANNASRAGGTTSDVSVKRLRNEAWLKVAQSTDHRVAG